MIEIFVCDEKEKEKYFADVSAINSSCYEGVERPSPELLKTVVTEGVLWIALDKGSDGQTTVGFAVVNHRGGIPYLWSIAVLPHYRHHGIASEMLGYIVDAVRKSGRQQMMLTVNSNNPAQKLYFDRGFRVYSVLRNYYGPNGDGLNMRKVI